MATENPNADVLLRVVLDDWVIPPDSVPVMILPGEAVIRVRADVAEVVAQVKRLTEAMGELEGTRPGWMPWDPPRRRDRNRAPDAGCRMLGPGYLRPGG
jgi:hypothetical protein